MIVNWLHIRPFFFVLLGYCFPSYSQVIPEQRRVDWTYAGKKDIFPNTTDTLNILDFGGSRDSTADNKPAIDMAMQRLVDHEGVIYFPPGKYLFKGAINMKAGVTIQGSGSEQTFFYFATSGAVAEDAFIIKNDNSLSFQNAIAGYTLGSNYLKVPSPSAFQGASYIEILQDNGAWDTNPADWAINTVGQIIPINKINNDTIFLKHSLKIDYTLALSPRLRPFLPIKHIAFKCFTIQRADNPSSDVSFFSFINAAECLIDGVACIKSAASHIKIDRSTNITISGSYFYDAFQFDGTSTRGYGITLFTRSGECLIENNIFRKLRHAIILKQGANGNVVGYNYIREGNRSEFPSDFGADISLHGHYAYANLIEGNIADNFFTDHTWGPSGPLNTFFRNKADGYGMAIFNSTNQTTSMQNYVGNDIPGNRIIPFYLQPLISSPFILNGSNHFSYANREIGSAIPSGTTVLNDISYYLNTKPSFWTGTNSWPSIGIPNANNTGSIPAKDRYLSGQQSVCPLFMRTATSPIRATVFKGTRLDDIVALNWTIEGTNLSEVEVQKSTNNFDFQTIATLSLRTATINDRPGNSRLIYYRLKMHDNLGFIFYSNTISIYNENGDVVAPPFFNGNRLIINIMGQAAMPYFVKIYTPFGALKTVQIIQNSNNEIFASNWLKGLWIINIQNNFSFNKTYKVVKL